MDEKRNTKLLLYFYNACLSVQIAEWGEPGFPNVLWQLMHAKRSFRNLRRSVPKRLEGAANEAYNCASVRRTSYRSAAELAIGLPCAQSARIRRNLSISDPIQDRRNPRSFARSIRGPSYMSRSRHQGSGAATPCANGPSDRNSPDSNGRGLPASGCSHGHR